jgi:hypothetical protein
MTPQDPRETIRDGEGCCKICFGASYDSTGEDYCGAMPEFCRDDTCFCHRFEEKFPTPQKESTHYQYVAGKEDCKCFSCTATNEDVITFIEDEILMYKKFSLDRQALVAWVEGEVHEITRIDRKTDKDEYWEGFNAALDFVINHLKI